MPIYTFLRDIPKELVREGQADMYTEVMYGFTSLLFESERLHQTHILRPCMLDVVHTVWKAFADKRIEGAFVYSNNSSSELVNCISFLLNFSIWKLYDPSRPIVFRMASYSGSPCRNGSLVKHFASIQHCLRDKGLRPCSSIHDLLFFDDLEHILQYEIPHYIRVPPYLQHTDMDTLLANLQPLSKFFTSRAWKRVKRNAISLYIQQPVYPFSVMEMEKEMFVGAIQSFVSQDQSAKPIRSRKTLKATRHRQGTRSNGRRNTL